MGIQIYPNVFFFRNGPLKLHLPQGFSFKAPTCLKNLYRVLRGMQIKKPILVEGPPGCGKSSSVMALAALTGHPITRLNLSEQTVSFEFQQEKMITLDLKFYAFLNWYS